MPETILLMVPIHLDALLLEQDRTAVAAMADFTRLPFFDGTRDVNSGTGYLSEAILSGPIQYVFEPFGRLEAFPLSSSLADTHRSRRRMLPSPFALRCSKMPRP